MNVGDTLRFAAPATVTWRSAYTAVVTVDGTGLATARAVGATAVLAISKINATQYWAASVTVRRKP